MPQTSLTLVTLLTQTTAQPYTITQVYLLQIPSSLHYKYYYKANMALTYRHVVSGVIKILNRNNFLWHMIQSYVGSVKEEWRIDATEIEVTIDGNKQEESGERTSVSSYAFQKRVDHDNDMTIEENTTMYRRESGPFEHDESKITQMLDTDLTPENCCMCRVRVKNTILPDYLPITGPVAPPGLEIEGKDGKKIKLLKRTWLAAGHDQSMCGDRGRHVFQVDWQLKLEEGKGSSWWSSAHGTPDKQSSESSPTAIL